MIQAIVFLPLIGAILAGLIAIFGAHARNPERRHRRASTTMPMATAPSRVDEDAGVIDAASHEHCCA